MNSPKAWNHFKVDKWGLRRVGDGVPRLRWGGDGVEQLRSEGVAAETFSDDAYSASENCRLTYLWKLVLNF